MQEPVSSSQIYRMLERFGAIHPTPRAIRMIACDMGMHRGVHFWELRVSTDRIKQAVEACVGLRGEASYAAFATALQAKQQETVSQG